MIEVKQLCKHFDDIEAIRELDLRVKTGSIYGLLGSNGAGKTTLLKTLAGIYREDGGSVQIDGQTVFENLELKQRIAYIPDTLYFFSGHTIDEMAAYYRSLYPRWNQERYLQMESVFPLSRGQKIHRLSKGMQRQVAFWLALSTMPDLLILDEPLDGLDTVMRHKVKNLLVQEVADRQMTILISSHHLRELENFCDHVGLLHEGRIILDKEIDDLRQDVHKIQVAFREMPDPKIFDHLQLLRKDQWGSVTILVARGSRQELLHRLKELKPAILDVLPLTLEEIFIYEMGDHGYELECIKFA